MASDPPPCRLRPGRFADLPEAARLAGLCFKDDSLWAILFPNGRQYPAEFSQCIRRIYQTRYWTSGSFLTLAVDDHDRIVGLSWWNRPADEFSFFQRLLSPSSWFAAFMRAALSVRNSLFPIRNIEQSGSGAYQRTVAALAPSVFTTPRRKQAWYLATLAVHPALQGCGIGSMILRDGMQKAAQRGKATWLVGVYGTDALYSRFDYVEVARANVGELSKWDGGYLMFNE